jgi:hypothetical protein
MSNKLILRKTNSPFSGQYADVNQGSVLSHAQLDGNFVYLKGHTIYSASTDGGILKLHKLNNLSVDVDLSSLVAFSGNTSGNCITDLYVSDIYGCSGLTLNGRVQQNTNLTYGLNSVAFGTNNESGVFQNEIITTITSGCSIYTGFAPDYYAILSGDVTTEWNNYLASGPIQITLSGSAGAITSTLSSTYYNFMDYGDVTFLISDGILQTGYTQVSVDIISQPAIDNKNTFAGGNNSVAFGDNSFIYSQNSIVNGNRSVVLGGDGITGNSNDTVYVPNFNIGLVNANDALDNILVRDTDGSIRVRSASSLGGSINYSNVIFVDALNGNDSTGVIGRFDKPFATIFGGSNQASSLSRTATDKALIYVRSGSYYFNGNLQNYLDYYCEPGVVFTGGNISPGSFGDVTSNLFGYAVLQNTGIDVRTASSCIFEFDYLSNTASGIYIAPAAGTATIDIKANYLYMSTIGTGYGISIRNSTNVTFNVSRGIEAVHSTIAFRFFTGTAEINSNIYLGSGNLYGGNYKQALICYDASTNGSITVNGNIINKDTVDYGGIGSLVTIYSGANPKLTINGNIVGGPIKALDGNTQTNATIEINGNLSSDNLYTVWGYGGGELVFKNSIIKNTGVNVASILGALNGTASIFFKDCYFYNGRTDSNLFVVNSTTCQLVLDGCAGKSEGALGNSIYSSVGAVNIRANNSRFNKDKSVDITDLYSPSGFIYDTNTIVPTKIN